MGDLAKPDLVQRDQAVTLIYETPAIYLTIRGKALEGGTEGDAVSVLNLQSKRTVTGIVVGRGQVAVSVTPPRPAPDTTSSLNAAPAAPVSVANANPAAAAKTE
jgi:flagella basal body P-ring formation protein FlgA